MTSHASAGPLIVGVPGTTLAAGEARLLAGLRPGGVILFRRNVESAAQLQALVAELRRAAPEALLFVDAEGGRVDRLAPVVGPAPAAATLARVPPSWARRAGLWVGRALQLFDCDADLAPVIDLDRGRRDNALDGRYLGATPRAVSARARAFVRGLHAAGVGACLKHFPGLGGAGEDTHHRGSVVDLDERALASHLQPFHGLAADCGAVLVSHAAYPAFDPRGLPASLSPAIATGLLRRVLRFRGLAISDDLEMKALGEHGGLAEVAAAAFAAGCDLLPVCHALEQAPEIAAGLARPALRARRQESARRLAAYHRHLRALRRARPRRSSLATVRRQLASLATGLREAGGGA